MEKATKLQKEFILNNLEYCQDKWFKGSTREDIITNEFDGLSRIVAREIIDEIITYKQYHTDENLGLGFKEV